MAYRILEDSCSVCGACEAECPNKAIRMVGDYYRIDASKCTECEGFFDEPQCALACSMDACVKSADT
ncbi:MAG: ferredoxin [Leptonema illini]|jgi:ferredoxin|uniref:Ferredoxin n=1 Tax=Leptonema illini TaxID=183 RepID=A0A833M3I7_9LEPT|nr:MAG: ferredoxin [Leptonema illini]